MQQPRTSPSHSTATGSSISIMQTTLPPAHTVIFANSSIYWIHPTLLPTQKRFSGMKICLLHVCQSARSITLYKVASLAPAPAL
ncbi:hypothetical protein L1987_30389 [Smallanthus sonchifolius]|uniref:Uncharacterized protein n=1 Tax=Smallanthus sonchifolius TaxID=185202 RepID=A0ACB9I2L7_9ASTR|nr:hypothetical protein L1987_30389 [Smallanthus sonchifolius]